MKSKVISWMLHNANRNPPYFYKERFYKIKDRLLKKYGEHIAYDCQHIKKECWSCDGTGVFKCSWKNDEMCWKCTKGVYTEFWVLLKVYRWNKYEFHIPTIREYSPKHWFADTNNMAIRKQIKGYINHKSPKFRLADECRLWLYLIYDFKLFRDRFGCSYHYNGFTPMVLINNIFNRIKRFRFPRLKDWGKNQWKVFEDIPF